VLGTLRCGASSLDAFNKRRSSAACFGVAEIDQSANTCSG
jgi:hypothetical protein